MLTLIIALIAFLTSLGPSWGPRNVLSVPNDYRVDLGYQLNQGQAVLVARYPLSNTTKLKLIKSSTYIIRTTLLSLSETYVMQLPHSAICVSSRPLHLRSTAPRFKTRAMSSVLKHTLSGTLQALPLRSRPPIFHL